jgi:acyl transferase domain-containing protein
LTAFIQTSDSIRGIAVIGMAGRFPGAPTLDAFWDNLRRGVESITAFPLTGC